MENIICLTSHVRYHGAELSDDEWILMNDNKADDTKDYGSLYDKDNNYIGQIGELY